MSVYTSPIPIKNVFYMLCYAWDVLPIKDDIKVGSEDISDAYNLLARVFSYGVGRLIRSGFHRAYVEREEDLSTLKGKILINESIRLVTQQKKKLVCSYDDYSTNEIFNQVLKYTIDSLISNPDVSESTKRTLKKQRLFFEGIKSEPPLKSTRHKLIISKNNAIYRLLISIVYMLYDNTMVNEENGRTVFKDFFRQDQMHKVFELFLLNFYAIHLDKRTYKVHAPKINWHIDSNAGEIWGGLFDVVENPGDRRTDIVIENKSLNLQLIFDAKYYQKTFVEGYMSSSDNSIRTSHLNQIRGYLLDSEFAGKKFGALLYPMVNNDLRNGSVLAIQGTPIAIKTINLNDAWQNIESDLLAFVAKTEEGLLRTA